jgi:hypothetical protein
VAATAWLPSTPNPTETPSPRSSLAMSAGSAAGENETVDSDAAGASQPVARWRRNEWSTGRSPPAGSGMKARLW